MGVINIWESSFWDSLGFLRPELMKEWVFEKNVINPYTITPGSGAKVWWRCGKCRYEWYGLVYSRARLSIGANVSGCAACSGRVVNSVNSVSVVAPHLVGEWSKVNKTSPDTVPAGSGKKVWWVCSICSYEWKAKVYKRVKVNSKLSCPMCLNKVVGSKNNLYDNEPTIMKDWDYSKNVINPRLIYRATTKRAWWKCSVCSYSWKTRIRHRTADPFSGCPNCSGSVLNNSNKFSTLFPDLLKEWDYEKNTVSPENCFVRSPLIIWWVCSQCTYEWKSFLYSRTGLVPSGCPKCAKGSVSKISQEWLDSLDVKSLIKEYRINIVGSFIKVDAYDPETNTVYEFLGDYWHGNPEVFSPEKINSHNKKSFGQLYDETRERIKVLKENGFNVVYIWENDFKGDTHDRQSYIF